MRNADFITIAGPQSFAIRVGKGREGEGKAGGNKTSSVGIGGTTKIGGRGNIHY